MKEYKPRKKRRSSNLWLRNFSIRNLGYVLFILGMTTLLLNV